MNRWVPGAIMLIGIAMLTWVAWPRSAPLLHSLGSSSAPVAKSVGDSGEEVQNYDLLRRRLDWEEKRLLNLQQTLADVQSLEASSQQARAQVKTLEASLATTQQRLAERQNEDTQIQGDAQAYNREVRSGNLSDQAVYEQRVGAVDDSLFDLQIQAERAQAAGAVAALPSLRAQMLALQKQKRDLEVSARVADLQARQESVAAAQDASDLRVQVYNERQNLLRQQADLAASLDYWKKQQAQLENPRREERLRILQNQVASQRQTVADLQRRVY